VPWDSVKRNVNTIDDLAVIIDSTSTFTPPELLFAKARLAKGLCDLAGISIFTAHFF
jgi:hypothetical protein